VQTYLIEIGAYDTGAAALTTLRFSSQPYLHPSAPGPFANRVKDLPTFRRDIFSKNTTGGAGAVSLGDMTLASAVSASPARPARSSWVTIRRPIRASRRSSWAGSIKRSLI
jgi:hypothetical protein